METGRAARRCASAVRGISTPACSYAYTASPLQSNPCRSAPPKWYGTPTTCAADCATRTPPFPGGSSDSRGTLLQPARSSTSAIASELRRRLTSRDPRAQEPELELRSGKSARRADVAYPRVRAHCASLEELCHCLPGKRSREEKA